MNKAILGVAIMVIATVVIGLIVYWYVATNMM